MLDALIAGRLLGTPQARTAKNSWPFFPASVRTRGQRCHGTSPVAATSVAGACRYGPLRARAARGGDERVITGPE